MGGNEISLYCFTTGLFNDFIVIADIFFRRSGFLFYIGFRFLLVVFVAAYPGTIKAHTNKASKPVFNTCFIPFLF